MGQPVGLRISASRALLARHRLRRILLASRRRQRTALERGDSLRQDRHRSHQDKAVAAVTFRAHSMQHELPQAQGCRTAKHAQRGVISRNNVPVRSIERRLKFRLKDA